MTTTNQTNMTNPTAATAAHLHPFTDPVELLDKPPRVMVGGDGCWVIDTNGNRLFDAGSALWCTSLGFSNQRLIDAATRQYQTLPYYHGFMGRTSEPAERLAVELSARLPGDLNHLFFGCSGSEAIDSAIKLARYARAATGESSRSLIIAQGNAYHGSGTMSAALSAMDYMHDGFELPLDGVVRIESPHHRKGARDGESELEFSTRRAAELDALIDDIGAERICAMIAEPVIGSGGAIPPPEGWWPAIDAVLRQHGVWLIADEVICGFGRTGQWFGSQTYGIEPDLMTMAKQLTSAYFPVSAVGISDHVYERIGKGAHTLGTLGHGFTYGGHPVGAAVALETLAIYDELDLVPHVGERATWFEQRLATIDQRDDVVEVRHVGLMAAVEVGPGRGQAVAAAAERRGVIFRLIDDTIAAAPPLIIDRDETNHIFDVLVDSLDEVQATAD